MSMVYALQGGWWGPMHGGPYMTGWGVMMIGMSLFWLLLVGLVIWLVVRGSALRKDGGPVGPAGDRAEAIVRERYARGEIDQETYERLLADLRRHG